MDWNSIHREILTQVARFSSVVAPHAVVDSQAEEHFEAHVQATETYGATIDAACGQFSRGKDWPELSDALSGLVLARLLAASELASLLSGKLLSLENGTPEIPTFVPASAATRQQIFQLLLIDYWWRVAEPAWTAGQKGFLSRPGKQQIPPETDDSL